MNEIRGVTLTGVLVCSRDNVVAFGPSFSVAAGGERVLGSVGRDEDGNTVLVVRGHVVVSAADDCLVVCWPQD